MVEGDCRKLGMFKGGLLCEWQYCRSEVSRNVTSGTFFNMHEACQNLFLLAKPSPGRPLPSL